MTSAILLSGLLFASAVAASEPVYITPAGKLYHRSVKCKALSASRVWLTRERAELEAQGVKRCSRATCYPRADDRPSLRIWASSALSLAAASAVDWHSSRGLRELNPLLAGRDGRFDAARGIALKAALVGAAIGTQWLVLRATSGQGRRAFAAVNFTVAGVTAGAAVRNYGLKGEK